MTKEEIEDYFKRVDGLGAKLTGEDKETYDWLIYGCNQCAKLLNEKEQQCKKQKEVINRLKEYIEKHIKYECDDAYNGMQFYSYHLYDFNKQDLLDILEEVSE